MSIGPRNALAICARIFEEMVGVILKLSLVAFFVPCYAQVSAPPVWTDFSVNPEIGPYYSTPEELCATYYGANARGVEYWSGNNVICMVKNEFGQVVGGQYIRASCGYLDGIAVLDTSGFPVMRCNVTPCPEDHAFDRTGVLTGSCIPVVKRFHNKQECMNVGNPIYPLSGAKRETLSVAEWSPGLSLDLTYNSGQRIPANIKDAQFAPRTAPAVGPMWLTNLHLKVANDPLTGIPEAKHVPNGYGEWVSMYPTPTGEMVADPTNAGKLKMIGSQLYRNTATKQIFSYGVRDDGDELISEILYSDGRKISLSYSDTATPPSIAPQPKLLITAQDTFGRMLRFNYSVSLTSGLPQVEKLTDANETAISFGYTPSGNLSTLTWPDGEGKKFAYDNPTLPWALTSTADAAGNIISSFGYDVSGTVQSSSKPGGVASYSTVYSAGPSWRVVQVTDRTKRVIYRDYYLSPPQGVELTLPNGAITKLGVDVVNGIAVITSQSQPAGAGCAASSSSISYDSNANKIRSDDFNGNRTCYAYDTSRRLETTRVEGLANTAVCADVIGVGASIPAGARKISTQWHPVWDQPTRIAAPKLLTTMVYNGQPDPTAGNSITTCAPSSAVLPDGNPINVLCKRIEQATTDTTGGSGFAATSFGARTFTYTYNGFGQMVSMQDPMANVTRYSYYSDTTAEHTQGDLKSITNALNHVTTYDLYNKNGQPLQITDPNSIVVKYTYDLRQRPRTIAIQVAANTYETTTLEYYPAGLLKTVKSPDGSWIGFDYDGAQRRKAIYDSAGNRINFDLDSAGNIKNAETRESWATSNVLRTKMSQVFDALGRVEQITGGLR